MEKASDYLRSLSPGARARSAGSSPQAGTKVRGLLSCKWWQPAWCSGQLMHCSTALRPGLSPPLMQWAEARGAYMARVGRAVDVRPLENV